MSQLNEKIKRSPKFGVKWAQFVDNAAGTVKSFLISK
jgi:hypothetical protein